MIRLANDPPVYCVIHGTFLGDCHLEGQRESQCVWMYGEEAEIEDYE